MVLASFLLVALSSVLNMKGVDKFGDGELFLLALINFEQLLCKSNSKNTKFHLRNL